ncbi:MULTISPECIES: sulfite exporter TauE/SafE family protein [unclassified Frankia]|uniref:sulfite exporter TauE/SafE family protein n=1 Tax=unclassified Frankia TaxID=2632575 RepID=UPI002AD324A7|nr:MULTISPECIES: sulfite exporter TauE/SafE family protein [unclassified Frankia]
MGPADGGLVAAAGLLAGAVNAVAGGGTLIAFPALLTTGMPALTANITSSVGLVTGYAGGALGYRRELAGQATRLRALAIPALLGGLTGAVVLVVTPAGAFRAVVGYLVVAACGLLGAQPWLARLVAGRRATASAARPTTSGVTTSGVTNSGVTWPTRAGVFLAGIYGSYFGAGLGVLLLGVLGILLPDDIQRTNAAKTLLSFGINAIGVTVFVVSAQVSWAFAAILLVTSYAGGVLGARLARVLPAAALRGTVVTLGLIVAVVLIVSS